MKRLTLNDKINIRALVKARLGCTPMEVNTAKSRKDIFNFWPTLNYGPYASVSTLMKNPIDSIKEIKPHVLSGNVTFYKTFNKLVDIASQYLLPKNQFERSVRYLVEPDHRGLLMWQ
jgi:hypothetical protein